MRRNPSRGVALLLSLAVLAVLSFLATTFIRVARVERDGPNTLAGMPRHCALAAPRWPCEHRAPCPSCPT